MNQKLATHFKNSERGQAIIVIVFAIIGIVGISPSPLTEAMP